MTLLKNKFLFPFFLIFTLFFTQIGSVFAQDSSLSINNEFIINQVIIEDFAKSITKVELEENPYLAEVINDMKEIIKDSDNIAISKFKVKLSSKDSFINHQKTKLEDEEINKQLLYTKADEEQLQRVDQLARVYYDYYKEHGTYPIETTGNLKLASVGFVNILKGVGLAFTESGLATRLAALGLVAAIDGPLPVGDFVALVTGAVIIGAFALDYVKSSTTSTAIANNIGINEGTTYKNESTKSLTQTKTISFPNSYKHWSAAPNNNWGGGIYILAPITFSQAVVRALALQDTYSLTTTDARSVAQGGSDQGQSPVHDFAHVYNSSGAYMYPNNKPHWHCIKYGARAPGHHWYG